MWQPSATFSSIAARAETLRAIREFFYTGGVMEVDLPVMGAATVTDPYLEPLTVAKRGAEGVRGYLQTSPEYFMKRMLARDAHPIYFLGKAFREDEVGRKHSPEFAMLEWYRPGFTDDELMAEVLSLIKSVEKHLALNGGVEPSNWVYRRESYEAVFYERLGVNPHTATISQLQAVAKERLNVDWKDSHRNTWLELLFSHLVEPALDGCVCVYDFPATQSALAKVIKREDGIEVAKRFELYINGIELANGYWELTDAKEQQRRFEQDLLRREELGLELPVIDGAFMAAMESGIPECAGVALGVDRLLMALLQKTSISEVLAFTSPQ